MYLLRTNPPYTAQNEDFKNYLCSLILIEVIHLSVEMNPTHTEQTPFTWILDLPLCIYYTSQKIV